MKEDIENNGAVVSGIDDARKKRDEEVNKVIEYLKETDPQHKYVIFGEYPIRIRKKGSKEWKICDPPKKISEKASHDKGKIIRVKHKASPKELTDEQKTRLTDTLLKSKNFKNCTTEILKDLERIINEEYDLKDIISNTIYEKELAETILKFRDRQVMVKRKYGKEYKRVSSNVVDDIINGLEFIFDFRNYLREAITIEEAKEFLMKDPDYIADFPFTGDNKEIYWKYADDEYPNIVKNPDQYITDEMVRAYSEIRSFKCDTSTPSLKQFISECKDFIKDHQYKNLRLPHIRITQCFRDEKYNKVHQELYENGDLYIDIEQEVIYSDGDEIYESENGIRYKEVTRKNEEKLSEANTLTSDDRRTIFECLDILGLVGVSEETWVDSYNTKKEINESKSHKKPKIKKRVEAEIKANKVAYMKKICYFAETTQFINI